MSNESTGSKISAALTARWADATPEERTARTAKAREAAAAKRKPRTMSEETRAKMSATHRARWAKTTPEQRAQRTAQARKASIAQRKDPAAANLKRLQTLAKNAGYRLVPLDDDGSC